MFHRRSVAALAASALLVCGGVVRASDTLPEATASNSVVFLDDTTASAPAAPEAPLPLIQGLLKSTGAGVVNDWVTITGYTEIGYTYNLDAPPNKPTPPGDNPGRIFDSEQNAPRLNQTELMISRSLDYDGKLSKGQWDFGGTIEMVYGSDARFFHANGMDGYDHYDSPINQFDLEQANVQIGVPVGTGLGIEIGKFDTLLGYEVTQPAGNAFYSRSFLYNYAYPVTQTGLLATYNPTDTLKVVGGVTLGWNQALLDNNHGDIDVCAQATWQTIPKTLQTIFATSIGPEQYRDCGDYTYLFEAQGLLTPPALSAWTFALDSVVEWAHADQITGGTGVDWLYGLTLYAGYTLNDNATLNARAEWLRDDSGDVTGLFGATGAGNLYEVTGGVTYKPWPSDRWLNGLEFRPELRADFSGAPVFPGNGTGRHDQETIGMDVIWAY